MNKLLAVVVLVTACSHSESLIAADQNAAGAQRPNILYFYVDDMGWGSIGPNGQSDRKSKGLPYVQTPNIDRLAAEGVNFRRGYACTVCSPSRSSQQTGFHQGHCFADRNDPDNAKKAMRSDDVLMGDVLSAAGYTTGYWGKWGYGGSKDMQNPKIENVQTLPTSHGYQHVLAELHHVRAHTFFQPTLWHAPARLGSKGGLELAPNSMAAFRNPRYPQTPAFQNHDDYPKTAYCDDSYAMAALDFVRDQGKNYNQTGTPFFGLLAAQIPHAPFGDIATLPKWNAAYKDDANFGKLDKQAKQWAAMVTRIDAHFGNILAALEDPNQDGNTDDSIVDNTLVIFQSDNGGPGGKSNSELDSNGGLRGVKGKIYEGGIRVPLVVRWPAKITAESKLKAGSNSDMVVDITDLLPTFCELADTRIPPGIDGVSIAPTLTGSGHQRKRDFIIHEAGPNQSIIRGNLKLIRGKKGSLELYDLKSDRAETTDIAASHPDLVKELEARLIGERVTEPKGFANTYHHFTGSDGAKTSDASNWSDYQYANDDIVYMTDAGGPKLSWVAKIANDQGDAKTATVDEDLQLLSLEIAGNEKNSASQSVVLEASVNLTGRNEIRIGPSGSLQVVGGTVSSLRWIEIQPGGSLTGTGTLDAAVYNNGRLDAQFKLSGDYRQSDNATLKLVASPKGPSFVVNADATIAGTLAVQIPDAIKVSQGQSFRVMSAKKITGKFANADDEVIATDGTKMSINYRGNTVTVVVK